MPESSCLVGSWLVGRKNPMQVVMSETVALAEDGCLRVTAYEDGYVILPGTRSGAGLPPDRAALLDAILGREGELRLRREPGPPASLRGTRISLAQLQAGVTKAARERGYLARPYYVLFSMAIAVVTGGFLMWRGNTSTALVLCMAAALLGTWSLRETHISKAGAAEQRRLLALQDRLRRPSRPHIQRRKPRSAIVCCPGPLFCSTARIMAVGTPTTCSTSDCPGGGRRNRTARTRPCGSSPRKG